MKNISGLNIYIYVTLCFIYFVTDFTFYVHMIPGHRSICSLVLSRNVEAGIRPLILPRRVQRAEGSGAGFRFIKSLDVREWQTGLMNRTDNLTFPPSPPIYSHAAGRILISSFKWRLNCCAVATVDLQRKRIEHKYSELVWPAVRGI